MSSKHIDSIEHSIIRDTLIPMKCTARDEGLVAAETTWKTDSRSEISLRVSSRTQK